MSEERERRLAQNEAVARDVNEVVDEVAGAWFEPDERLEFRCECSRAECTAHVSLTGPEYQYVRSDARRFVVVAGHEDPTIEHEVGRIGEYVLVEKHGAGADVARDTDPRA